MRVDWNSETDVDAPTPAERKDLYKKYCGDLVHIYFAFSKKETKIKEAPQWPGPLDSHRHIAGKLQEMFEKETDGEQLAVAGFHAMISAFLILINVMEKSILRQIRMAKQKAEN